MSTPSPAGIRLPGETDWAGDPTLFFHAELIEPDLLPAARASAFAHGRVLERDGAAVLSWGTAAAIELPGGLADPLAPAAAQALLASLPAHDESSRLAAPSGPIALGSLAFDPSAPGQLLLPRVTIAAFGTDPPIAIAIGGREELEHLCAQFPFDANAPTPRAPARTPAPDRFELVSVRSHEDFEALVAVALEAIAGHELDKVVLAREVTITANRPFAQADLLERVRRLHPSCFAFAIDTFLGASPELLCRRQGAEAFSHPLAGTVARSGDPEEDDRLARALLASPKERAEHRFVVEAIAAGLAPCAHSVEIEATPRLLALRNVAHLATEVRATLRPDHDGRLPGALELVGQLHPTPAVGGHPRAAALEFLAKHEDLDRDRYAGPVGWLRADGDGEWWLGIRSGLFEGRRARLFAGVGIVAGSEPHDELTETQLKLQALLAAAVRP